MKKLKHDLFCPCADAAEKRMQALVIFVASMVAGGLMAIVQMVL